METPDPTQLALTELHDGTNAYHIDLLVRDRFRAPEPLSAEDTEAALNSLFRSIEELNGKFIQIVTMPVQGRGRPGVMGQPTEDGMFVIVHKQPEPEVVPLPSRE